MARLKVIFLSLHLALFSSIFLNMVLKVPLIRSVLGFIYLTFVPGFLLISIFKLRLNLAETVLYSVGISLSLVMLLGLIVNQFYPLVGVEKPLSLIPVLVTISIITLVCSFKIDGDVEIRSKKLTPFTLGLMLLPFLSIFGVYVFNMYNINLLNLFVILLIATTPILSTLKKISQKYTPFVIYTVSFSILYNVCLISAYLWGWDIHHHYYFTMIVYKQLYWHSSIYPLLITTIVPVIYSVVTAVNLVWFYKVMFPFFVTLIPLGIYDICKKEFNEWYISTLAPFSFMFYYWFYKTFPVKQIPSELFLILIVGLLIDESLPNFNKMVMATLFSFGLTVSHYGVSYFFMIVLLSMVVLHILKFGIKQNFTKFNFVVVYIVLIVGWYMFVYDSYKFDQIANIGYNILVNLISLIKSPPARSGVSYIEYSTPTLVWRIYKYINAVFVIFLFLGVLQLLYSLLRGKLYCRTHTFAFISIGTCAFLLSSVVITYGMGFDRTLQVSLPILAPYVIIGFKSTLKILFKIFKNFDIDIHKIIRFAGIFFAIYFLFNSGFIFYVTGNRLPPYCITLDKKCWQSWRVFYLSEVCGVLWLKGHYSGRVAIPFTKVESLMSEIYGHGNYKLLTWGGYFTKYVPSGTHIYFSSAIDKAFIVRNKFTSMINFLHRIMLSSSRVYTSGYGECYVS